MRTEFHTATLVMPKISRKRLTPRGITFQELLQGLKTLDFLRMGSHVRIFGFVVFMISSYHIFSFFKGLYCRLSTGKEFDSFRY